MCMATLTCDVCENLVEQVVVQHTENQLVIGRRGQRYQRDAGARPRDVVVCVATLHPARTQLPRREQPGVCLRYVL